jgi:hypothetical protein
MWSFQGTLIGALVSIGTVVFVEYLRRPSLQLSGDPPFDNPYHPRGRRPATEVRFLRVRLLNKTLPWWAGWIGSPSSIRLANGAPWPGVSLME